jgi:serine/threonine protein phosphatase PrpC
MSWKMAHACVRGSAHERSGLPNQDAAQCVVIPGEGEAPAIAVAAVSDGHGGARHFRSQIGASLAVSTSVDVLLEFFSGRDADAGTQTIDPDQILELERSLVDNWRAAVSSHLENHPLTREELQKLEAQDGAESRITVETAPVLAYGATLLVTAATGDLILFLQLGDGEILCVTKEGQTTRPMPEDLRLSGNRTTSLCQPEAWHEFRSAWLAAQELPALVLLATDGYPNSFRSNQDFLKIGSDYLAAIREQGLSKLAEELPEKLRETSRQGSGDDITLAILRRDLRAVHSGKHRRRDNRLSRTGHTRKSNRKLQLTILLLILAMVGAGIYLVRGKLHSVSPNTPHPKRQGLSSRVLLGPNNPRRTPKYGIVAKVPSSSA